jgi:HD-GYP domain-containing protein (c-di-GMP phosphodiesterase class II)
LSNSKEASELIEVRFLRIGMYVELDVGWLAHPFPTGSFRITSEKQIDTIRGLGQARVRWVPARSELTGTEAAQVSGATQATSPAGEREEAQRRDALARQERAELLAAQQRSLTVCEKQFNEATRLYRKTVEQVHSHPREAAEQAQSMVAGLLLDMLGEGESIIRLLSESAGDKSAMHPVNVTIVSLLLGKAMGMPRDVLQDLGTAAYLHDLGKIQLPERVRWFEDNFSSAEYKLYQDHVAQGVLLGKSMELSRAALLAIAQHHELADGTGFPARVKSESMSPAARILALVNRYDNLCNPSRVTAALTPHESLALIFAQMKTRFDSVALSAFIRMMGVYPPGSVVQLIDDRYAIVVSVNSSRPLKPRILVHEPGVPRHEALIVDLEQMPFLGIRRSLKPSALPPASLDYLAPRQRITYYFEQVEAPLSPQVDTPEPDA